MILSIQLEVNEAMDFYKGQAITLISSTGLGTGTDVRARLFASHLSEYTGARVIVENMSAHGSLEGANHTYKANPDGLTLCAIAAGALVPISVLGLPGAEYKLNELSYIGLIRYLHCMAIWVGRDGFCNSVKDLQQAKGLRFGSSTPAAHLSQGAALAIDILGLDGKVFAGFENPALISEAIAINEADAVLESVYPGLKYAEKGQIKPLFIMGSQRNKALPGIPAITELASLSKEQKDLLAAFEAIPHGTPFFGPPGLPKDILEFLRQAFEHIVGQEDFRKQNEKESGSPWSGHLSGEKLAGEIRIMMKDQATYQMLYQLVKKYLA